MMTHLFLLAAASGGGSGGGGDLMSTVLMFAPLILIFYLLLIRPQRKRDQERKEMLAQIRKGDKVATAGGIIGRVVKLSDHEATLLVDTKKGVELRFTRSAIASIIGAKEGEGDT